jgi:hypothetical protein
VLAVDHKGGHLQVPNVAPDVDRGCAVEVGFPLRGIDEPKLAIGPLPCAKRDIITQGGIVPAGKSVLAMMRQVGALSGRLLGHRGREGRLMTW